MDRTHYSQKAVSFKRYVKLIYNQTDQKKKKRKYKHISVINEGIATDKKIENVMNKLTAINFVNLNKFTEKYKLPKCMET